MKERKLKNIGIVGSDPRKIFEEIFDSGLLSTSSLTVACMLTDDLNSSSLKDFINQAVLDMVIVSSSVEPKSDTFWKKLWSETEDSCLVLRPEI